MQDKKLKFLEQIETNDLIAEASCLAMLEIDSESSKDFSLDDMAYFLANENSFFASAEIPNKNKIKQNQIYGIGI